MGIFDSFRKKGGNVADKAREEAAEGAQKTGDFVNEKTGGRYSEHIDKGVHVAKQRMGSGDDQAPGEGVMGSEQVPSDQSIMGEDERTPGQGVMGQDRYSMGSDHSMGGDVQPPMGQGSAGQQPPMGQGGHGTFGHDQNPMGQDIQPPMGQGSSGQQATMGQGAAQAGQQRDGSAAPGGGPISHAARSGDRDEPDDPQDDEGDTNAWPTQQA